MRYLAKLIADKAETDWVGGASDGVEATYVTPSGEKLRGIGQYEEEARKDLAKKIEYWAYKQENNPYEDIIIHFSNDDMEREEARNTVYVEIDS